jgi:two-component system, OmpR family, response regulator
LLNDVPHRKLETNRYKYTIDASFEPSKTNAVQPHILLVEDDREISALTARFLRANDCRVTAAGDGREMLARIEDHRIDLVVLDVMLPGEDGLSLLKRMRPRHRMPVILLTARTEEIDRVLGLELGADDYVTKPFSPRELLARIRAVLRRTAGPEPETSGLQRVSFDGWLLDVGRRTLTGPTGALVTLTSAEWDLLRVLAERPGRVLSREQLVDLTRGRSAGPFDRSVDILISRLRRKIEADPNTPSMIKTVRSGGYLFTPRVEPAE